jgi:ribosomal protein S12
VSGFPVREDGGADEWVARYKLIRGAQDLGAVAGRVKGRSKYGGE